jgi:hypothetical protein
MDPDQDPGCPKTYETTLTSFFKKSQNSRNQGFSYYFCLMIEGSGYGSVHHTNGDLDTDPYFILMVSDPDPGGPKTYGSGSATLLKRLPAKFFLKAENWSEFVKDATQSHFQR